MLFAGQSDADYHIGQAAPFVQELGNEVGWMLEVGIEDDGGLATAPVEAGGDGDFFAKVTDELDRLDDWVGGR